LRPYPLTCATAAIKDYELVDGRLVERNTSALSSWIAGKLHQEIGNHCEVNACGWSFPDGTGYQCFPVAPRRVRKPDVSVYRPERLPASAGSEGYLSVAPDLVVEVISPGDPARELDLKVKEWVELGVPLVWVVHPDVRAVQVHRRGGPVSWLRADDELSGEDVFPGFRCRFAALFPPCAEAGTSAGASTAG
jgi:Uma2 family endonuclease